jgi:hypothetical protein
MKKYDIVVARYNENLDWIKLLKDKRFNIKIYNKGEDNIDLKCEKLENYGRDAHTFVNYIVENYHKLPEYVIFLQGDPLEHCINAIQMIKNHKEEEYICLSDNVIEEGPTGWYEKIVGSDSDMFFPNMTRFKLSDTACFIFDDEAPGTYYFGAGQQYIVHKKYILNRSLDFYKNILERFKTDYVLPWHLERMWFTIFKF